MTFPKTLSNVVFCMVAATIAFACGAASAETIESKVVAAIETIRVLERPGRDTLATVWDGDKYIQCRHMSDQTLRCEAAGSKMQVSLSGTQTYHPRRLIKHRFVLKMGVLFGAAL